MNEEIKSFTAEQIEERSAQIVTEIEQADEARLAELNEEIKALEARKAEIELENRKADMVAVAQGAGKVVEKMEERTIMTNEEVRRSQEYINAFAEYIKTGDDKECRALLTTQVSGVVPVPEIVDSIVRTAWENDQIMSRVKKTYIRGNLKTTFERSASEAYVHTEGTSAPTEEELLLGIVSLIPRNIKKWITISDEAVAMGGEAFVRYIYDELTYQIVKKLAALGVGDITSANTSHGSTAIGIPQLAAAPGATTFQKAMTKLTDEANVNNLVVLLNPATDAAVIDAVAAGNFSIDPYAGMTKIYTSALPAYSTADADAVYAIVGDLSALQFNFPEGDDVLIKWDDMSLAESDLVKVVGREYAAHAVTAPGRLVNVVKPQAST
jgi:HK97 family phage major capsid protein